MRKLPENSNRVKVKINGEDYFLKGSASQEYIKKVASYVDEKFRLISKLHPELGRVDLAVLTAIQIADEYFTLKAEYEEFLKLFDEEKKDKR
ncbi:MULTISPECIES: cell division protein ZapA [Thermovenabulum]|uniref:Cell division protein ZapA n=1 Tax=Thermovenabulum gondwanense TaxID=520767 RepID=A0A161PTM3_9FIRM|nr:cell division protein ZapA [Thermovenabulum gondwanense]KYO65224.1 Cell division protein ZapA [Thermovenabulum gondwanense]